MNLERYQSQLIALIAIGVLVGAIFYKYDAFKKQAGASELANNAVLELKEVIALKKIWAESSLTKKVEKLQKIVPKQKVKWTRKKRKLTASFKGLTPQEVNKLIGKIMSLAVEIENLSIQKSGETYSVELKCKWSK